jgi:AhpD family alkylhydroperoxidase
MLTTDQAASHGKGVLCELSPLHRELRRAIPDVYRGFGELHHSAFAEGALTAKTKELIALAVSVVEGCDGCIASHAQAAARAGAARQEAAEAIGVAFLMRAAAAVAATQSPASHPSAEQQAGSQRLVRKISRTSRPA